MYYSDLDEKNVTDNSHLSKTVKPLLPDKLTCKELNLVENEEVLKTDLETTKVLSIFFSNVLQSLNISKFSQRPDAKGFFEMQKTSQHNYYRK